MKHVRLILLLAAGAALGQDSIFTEGASRYFKEGGRRWWYNPQMATQLGLTADQQKRMADILQQHRITLIDADAALQKEEAALDPLVAADQPDDARVLAQVDRVAQARAELEKVNSRMLWALRRVLTSDQWRQLQTQQTTNLKEKYSLGVDPKNTLKMAKPKLKFVP